MGHLIRIDDDVANSHSIDLGSRWEIEKMEEAPRDELAPKLRMRRPEMSMSRSVRTRCRRSIDVQHYRCYEGSLCPVRENCNNEEARSTSDDDVVDRHFIMGLRW